MLELADMCVCVHIFVLLVFVEIGSASLLIDFCRDWSRTTAIRHGRVARYRGKGSRIGM